MENLDPPPPPPPQIKDGKMARFCPSRGFILDLGDGGLLFHFILSKIVAKLRVQGPSGTSPPRNSLSTPPPREAP